MPDSSASCNASARHTPTKLWRAFRVAPAVAPVVFAVLVFSLGSLLRPANDAEFGTPAGIIAVPILALTLGVPASYGIAGLVGMPIVFALRRRHWLNGWSIHLAALAWGIFLCLLLWLGAYACTAPPRPPLSSQLPGALVSGALLIPCILLSATTFWWMTRSATQ